LFVGLFVVSLFVVGLFVVSLFVVGLFVVSLFVVGLFVVSLFAHCLVCLLFAWLAWVLSNIYVV